MLLSLVNNGKITNVGVGCASGKNYCRMPNLVLVYSLTLKLQNKQLHYHNFEFSVIYFYFGGIFHNFGNFNVIALHVKLGNVAKYSIQLYFMHKTIKKWEYQVAAMSWL